MLQISDRSQFNDDVRIAIIDPNLVQASEIRSRFDQLAVVADAAASVTDFASACGDPSIVLVHDHAGSVAEALRWSLSQAPSVPVLAYSWKPTVEKVVRAMKAGASDYLECPLEGIDISRIVERANQESVRSIHARERQGLAKWAIERLSSREKEVLVALSQGLTSVQIAETLAISPRTVETHRYNLRRKLGSIRTAEAIRLVFENGLGGTADKGGISKGDGCVDEAQIAGDA